MRDKDHSSGGAHLRQPEETTDLLSTKLAPPHLRTPYVRREALLARLDDGLDHKLTLISAPAGFGKTTLVGEWIAEHNKDQHAIPIAWVGLDERDNDPVRFWRYVLTACLEFGEGVARSSLAMVKFSPDPQYETLQTLLINELAQLPGKVVLILEDYHLITAKPIHETLTYLIDHLPPQLHLVITTRSDPPLPLARLRARNDLNELRAADLRFTVEEMQSFLQQFVHFTLPDQAAVSLAERTEGWAAGLRLVTLAIQGMQGQPEVERYLAGFTGSHRPIVDYLVADVFNAQPETVQDFLLQTSPLKQLNGPLCDAVTGRNDSALVLEQLERSNLFIIPLDRSGQWYRYHNLFAEAMQHYAQTRPGAVRLEACALKASRWYDENGMLADAIEAALDAQDFSRASNLIQRIITPRLVQNEFHTLRRWMEQLPEAVLRSHPEICLTFATAILFTSNRHAPETRARMRLPLEIAEQHWRKMEDPQKIGEVEAFRSLVDWLQRDIDSSFTHAEEALKLLPKEDRQWRGISLIMVGVGEMIAGQTHQAHKTISEGYGLCEASQNIFGTLDSLLLLGENTYQLGKLHQSEQIYRQVIDRLANAPMDPALAAIRRGRALLGLALVHLEWNELDSAEAEAAQAVEVGRQNPDEILLYEAPLVVAQVKMAKGDHDQAARLLNTLTLQEHRSFLFRFPQIFKAWLDLIRGDPASVRDWASSVTQPGRSISAARREQEMLMLARLQIAQEKYGEAACQLNDLLVEARKHGRTRIELQIMVLMALAAIKDHANTSQWIIQALSLAQPEGFQRVFLDEGKQLAVLIREALPEIRDEQTAAYARGLLYNLALDQKRSIPSQNLNMEALIEPLSDQEQRVLRLLAAGLSNPEIASELVISINTVKTHVKNIYSKLGVSSRQEAYQAARSLKLS